jgi:hypothetical protein
MANIEVSSSYAARQPKSLSSNLAFVQSALSGLQNCSARSSIRSVVSALIQNLADGILIFSSNALFRNYRAAPYAIITPRSLTLPKSLLSRLLAAAESSKRASSTNTTEPLHGCCKQLSPDTVEHLPCASRSGHCNHSIRTSDFETFFQIFARTFAMTWEVSSSD